MQVIDTFKALCSIPRCSHHTEAMRAYLQKRAQAAGYRVQCDGVGNLLCTKPGAKVTLQAHYDMVCIGESGPMELREEGGWLRAEASTLGADNGIGMAMMLKLMEEGYPVDALFTADEEVGLVGARNLELEMQTPYLLNLDSEEEGVVTIGCAGGIDMIAAMPVTTYAAQSNAFEVAAGPFAGGHSGIDIDKGIPNAIKELAAELYRLGLPLVGLQGGERRNAIAKRAAATVASLDERLELDAKSLGKTHLQVIEESEKIIAMLHGFAHGVRDFDAELGIVRTSVNLAQVEIVEGWMNVHLSLRGMDEAGLRRLESETQAYFNAFGATVRSEGYYPPWQPERNTFALAVVDTMREVCGGATLGAIHAGLECGVIGERAPGMQMASIGPNIVAPHSTAERVELASVERVYEVVKRVVTSL